MAERPRPKLYRYEIDEVWGDVSVKVGAVIVDKWKANRTWNVFNFSNDPPEIGGWHAKLLEPASLEIAQQVYDQWDKAAERRRAERMA